jgi:hypothetical protein
VRIRPGIRVLSDSGSRRQPPPRNLAAVVSLVFVAVLVFVAYEAPHHDWAALTLVAIIIAGCLSGLGRVRVGLWLWP